MDKMILEAKREVLVAYYTKISTNNLSADQILDALEVDMEFLKQEIALAEANELLKQNEAKGIPKTKAMNKTGKRIPILDAKHIGIRFGYSQVIITALDRGQVQPLVGVVLF